MTVDEFKEYYEKEQINKKIQEQINEREKLEDDYFDKLGAIVEEYPTGKI